MQEELMLTRRRRTLSSISNYIPLHIILNQPAGVTFSITVPKSFTIEQLARQIEAEYAFLVEREVGHSRYPVIECGALFDHIELDRSLSSVVRRSGRHQQQRESLQQKEEKKEGEDEEEEDAPDGEGNKVEAYMDEREEAESRGVQLRFSDKVEDVLDRNSTVHVVNIDQGKLPFDKSLYTPFAPHMLAHTPPHTHTHTTVHPTFLCLHGRSLMWAYELPLL
ncbi:MAG: hypothetical protein J3Q66DRAFT_134693 [Benniella sp.]|nr:MAG: hypothetical protein J3Q66DRAFT_134693 [Benniella sp.]